MLRRICIHAILRPAPLCRFFRQTWQMHIVLWPIESVDFLQVFCSSIAKSQKEYSKDVVNWPWKAMALSAEQCDRILILESGDVITSEKLSAFYAKHPAHRSLVKNMRSFCEQHPDRISIRATEGCHYSLKIAVWKEDKVVDLLRTFMQKRNGTVTLADLEGFSTRHPSCGKAIHSGGDPC